ncbi:MAG: acyl-CoA mutase large subunit family protein [Saprospiraceae bacterium]|nr:acyl-CoA mutase large subunit family protein [Saprospiraceae bacterium]
MNIFNEFSAASTEQWEEIIRKDLKGGDYEKKLVWKTLEGLKIKPYYRKENLENIEHLKSLPGEFPFVRGNRTKDNSWEIRQEIVVNDFQEANKFALRALNKGAEAIAFKVRNLNESTQMKQLLLGIDLEKYPVHFSTALSYPKLLDLFIGEIESRNLNKTKITGSFNFDFHSYQLVYGSLKTTYKDAIIGLIAIIEKLAKKLPNFKVVNLNGQYLHNAGATIIQELAFVLSSANEYMNSFINEKIQLEAILPKLQFTFALGSNYFMEISKIRAVRMLWANVLKQYNVKDESLYKIHIHGVTSNWNKSIFDPYVNLLRTTTEAMSGAIGGLDSMSVLPFDNTYKSSDEISRRMARNQQIILKEESYLDKIVDPSAGSYYIENLTDLIASASWDLFQKIEEQGGFIKAIENNFIYNEIDKSCAEKDMDIALRKINILGTNQYPNLNETMFDSIEFEKDNKNNKLKEYRGAEAFDDMRLATEKYVKNGGKKPSVFLFTIGNLAMRKARAAFITNFFGCGGFEIVDNPGFDKIEDGVKSAIESKSEIIVFCSSDEEYKILVPEISKELKKINPNIKIIVAGYPKDIIDELLSAGIDDFVHVKTNVLEALAKYQKIIGII